MLGGRQGSLIVLAISIAAGLAVAGAWLTMAGPGRKLALALVQPGRRATLSKAALSLTATCRNALRSLARQRAVRWLPLPRRGRHTH